MGQMTHERKQLAVQETEPAKSLITSYIHAHAQDQSVPSDVDSADAVIGVGYLSMNPAQRMRAKRLLWLFERIRMQSSSTLSEDLRRELMARFGVTYRLSGEYLRVLAGARLIVCVFGRWMTAQQFSSDPFWNSRETSQAKREETGDTQSRRNNNAELNAALSLVQSSPSFSC